MLQNWGEDVVVDNEKGENHEHTTSARQDTQRPDVNIPLVHQDDVDQDAQHITVGMKRVLIGHKQYKPWA